MSARHDNADGPEDIDAAFAEIVAGLEQDAPIAHWPEEQDPSTSAPHVDDQAHRSDAPNTGAEDVAAGPRDWSASEEAEDEGHFEPPEPPPLPKPRVSTVGGIVLIALGILLLVVPGLAGLGSTFSLPLGLIAISAGIGWLLFRMRQGPPHSEDGAQL